MKKLAVLFVMCALCVSAFAQQITRFGVVDTARVYNAYFKSSSAVRGYEKKKSEAQEEIDKRTEELRALKSKRAEIESSYSLDRDMQLDKLDDQISRKTQSLTQYTSSKNMELEAMRKSMQNSDEFYKKLYAVIGRVAESGGYSAILSLQQAGGILWYSPSVDVTEDIINALNR